MITDASQRKKEGSQSWEKIHAILPMARESIQNILRTPAKQ